MPFARELVEPSFKTADCAVWIVHEYWLPSIHADCGMFGKHNTLAMLCTAAHHHLGHHNSITLFPCRLIQKSSVTQAKVSPSNADNAAYHLLKLQSDGTTLSASARGSYLHVKLFRPSVSMVLTWLDMWFTCCRHHNLY